jgi:hypothetical protein
MSGIDEEEIVKALSLEEAALNEFKRRKNSCPAPQSHSKTAFNGKHNSLFKIVKSTSNGICEYF